MALLDINKIRTDGGTQHRVRVDDALIAEYTEAYLDGKKLPPVKLIFDGKNHWLWDGFQRVQAARDAGRRSINVEIEEGTQRDAFIRSLKANADHGARRTNDDKRAAVVAALQDSELASLSDRQIAELCDVSHPFVGSIREPRDKVERPAKLPASGNVSTGEARTPPVDTGSEPSMATPRDDSEKQPGPTTTKTPGTKPVGAIEEITRERDEAVDKLAELQSAFRELFEEHQALARTVDADDQIKTALEEAKKERLLRIQLEERLEGLMSEKTEAVRSANHWKNKAKS